MPFVGRLAVEVLDDGVHMQVLEDCGFLDARKVFWPIKAGLVSDGASIPRAFWTSVGAPFNGKYRRIAFAHDQAYATPGVDKDSADRMLREGAIEEGCPAWLADAIFEGVRVGGGFAFSEDQAAAKALAPTVVVTATSSAPASPL